MTSNKYMNIVLTKKMKKAEKFWAILIGVEAAMVVVGFTYIMAVGLSIIN